MKDKDLEKLEKYQLLKDEIAKMPVVMGALVVLSINSKKYMKRIGVNVRLEMIQKTALPGTAKILRKAMSLYEGRKERPGTCGDLL